MKTIVKINGVNYVATKRKTKGRSDCFDVTFRPEGKRKIQYVAGSVISTRTGFMGGGFGIFGSPMHKVNVYCIEGYGDVRYIGQDEMDFIAKKFNKENNE